MNIEREYSTELTAINTLVHEAKQQYDGRNRLPESIPADYRVLFVLFKDVTMANVRYAVTSNEEVIFDAAVINFKNTVENFAYPNVHMICDVQKVTDALTFDTQGMIRLTDVIEYYDRFAPTGSYDAVITVTKACGLTGITDRNMFNSLRYYGYSHCVIRTEDLNRTLPTNPNTSTPYLVTTNTFIHEWMHQLEAFRKYELYDGYLMYPYTHTYEPNWGSGETEPERIRTNYSWNTTYFNNTTVYPDVVERSLTSYYRAVLACEVTYIPDNNRPIGMYPKFWKITPHKIVLGRYLIQNSSGQYYYYDANTPSSPYKLSSTYSHDPKFHFDIRYAFDTKNFNATTAMIHSNTTLNYTPSTCTFTRIGPYDTGLYYFINETLNKTLGYSLESSQTFSMVSIYSTYPKRMFLSHYGNSFYKVKPELSTNLYLRTQSDSIAEGTKIGIYGFVLSHISTSTWQFAYSADQSYSIYPLATVSKSAAFYSDYLRLTTVGGTNSQRWRLEKTNNGKFLFNGQYKICTPDGKYIRTTDNSSLYLSDTETTWNVELDSTYGTDNFYRIYTEVNSIEKYFDVLNAANTEGNTVQLQSRTGHPEAQTWKFMQLSDGNFWIVPHLSITRGLLGSTTFMHISESPMEWKLERIGDLP